MTVNFELLDLRAFLAVAELGSFNKAAALLNMSQPALSRRIQALEASIGAPLLERTTRRVAPSAVGAALQPMIRRLLDELEEQLLGLSAVGGKQQGQVTLACVPTAAFYFLPQAIERFAQQYPNIRFRILDLSANHALDAVARGEAEFGVNLTGVSHPELSFTPLVDDPFVLACRRDHPLARRKKIDWSDLEGHRLVGVSRASGNRMILDAALANTGVRLNFMYVVNHLNTSLGLVERGLGASVLPRLATPPADHPLIVSVPIDNPKVHRTIGLVERRAGRLSPPAQRFRDMLAGMWSRPDAGRKRGR